MAAIRWIDGRPVTERAVGKDHPTYTDVLNRPGRDLLTEMGANPDADVAIIPSIPREGIGSPDSAITAPIGKTFVQKDSTNGEVPLWVKVFGALATGWRRLSEAITGDNSTLNAINFDGATYEAKVTAAVTACVALGKKFCKVNQSYNASLVTFNTNVQMIREGGPPASEGFDVHAYGAYGNNTNSDRAAFNAVKAAINAKPNTPPYGPGGGKMLLQGGKGYRFDRPWIVNAKGMAIRGPARSAGGGLNNAAMYAAYSYGPVWVVASETNGLPVTVASLVSGPGAAFAPPFDSGFPKQWLNLRDAATLDINGLPAFCVEIQHKPASLSDGIMVISSGRLLPNDPGDLAFEIGMTSGKWTARLTTSGTPLTFLQGTSTVVAGTRRHVALTYDGSTARLFVEGALEASATMTGTIKQGIGEDVTTGLEFFAGFENGKNRVLAGGAGSVWDALRVSNVARYIAPFTAPTSKPSVDANTLMLINGDLQDGPMTRGQTKDGDAWLVVRDQFSDIGYEAASDLDMEGMDFENTTANIGLMFANGHSFNPRLHRVTCVNMRDGIVFVSNGNHYGYHWGDVYITTSSAKRHGLVLRPFTGLGHIDNLFIVGYQIPLVGLVGQVVFNNVFISGQSDTILGLLLNGTGGAATYTFNQLSISTEAGVNAAWRGALAVGGGVQVIINGGGCETAFNQPPILLDGPFGLVWQLPYFNLGGSPGSVCKRNQGAAAAVPTRPAIFKQPHFNTGVIPLADVAGDAAIEVPGVKPVAFSATPTFDAHFASVFVLDPLTANVTSSTLSNVTPGQPIDIIVKQDATGSRTFTPPTNVKGFGAISAAANSVSHYTGRASTDGNVYGSLDIGL